MKNYNDNIQVLKRLFNTYTRKHLKKILLSVFFSVILALSTASIAWLLDPAIEKIFVNKDKALILTIPILIIVAFIAKGGSLYLAKVTMIKVGRLVKEDIQLDLVNSLINSDTEKIEKKHTGKFVSNLTFDAGLIENICSVGILNLFKDFLTLIALMSVMFYQNWKLSLFAILMIPLASFAAKSLGKRIGKVSTEAQERSGLLNAYLIELLSNHKLIKVFQKEDYETERSSKFIKNLAERLMKSAIIFVRASPIMETLTGIMIAGIIYYSGSLIISGELGINNFFSFLAAMMLAYQPVRSLATLNITINSGLAAARRIFPIIDEENKIKEISNPLDLNVASADIKIEGLTFKYNKIENMVLKNVSLNFEGGKMTALVGHSGAGKSTIMNMIPRFYDPEKGDILIDNQSIYKSRLKDLRSNISLVSQETTLFDDTVKNNIIYANLKASDEEINEAIKYSYAEEFINKLPNKLNTIIGENGVRLSGGEKQRLSIARAILKKSRIILLDEATSSLDADTEKKIQDAINFLTQDKTTIVIAHRLSTILNSSKIYVVNKGEIVDSGGHEELIKNSNIYKNFYEKQIKKS
tara:strand:- start:18 stop:1769 length:1752 start_codon:yes stop_codon:yes gene_type:complete